ncbi:MAG: PD40 domain-containing protein [Nocardioidaceae bacterium]|nr:PD40 domain-containing protein [Nocardioidaceae bacterium]
MAAGLSFAVATPSQATYPNHNGRIAFQAEVGKHIQLFTMSPSGHNMRQLTHGVGDSTRPDWSPNGRLIAFEFDLPVGGCHVRLLRLSTGRIVDLTQDKDVCEQAPAFTPSGKRIIFVRFDGDIEAMWSMNLAGGDRHRIRVAGEQLAAPAVSPDGTTLSFVAYNGKDLGQALETVPLDGSGGGITRLMPYRSNIAIKQDWAPNGRHLVFTKNADRPDRPANIFTIRPNGTGLHRLTHSRSPELRFNVGGYSPNGHWIVYRKTSFPTGATITAETLEQGLKGQFSVYRMHPDGSGKQRILGPSTFLPRYLDWGPATISMTRPVDGVPTAVDAGLADGSAAATPSTDPTPSSTALRLVGATTGLTLVSAGAVSLLRRRRRDTA